ncbi:MAG: alpha/beta hydrolase [Solirubrobacteraceae bacterium]|nr:alpha/beta hydrolase [Solirubrobacteraceae bacterium]
MSARTARTTSGAVLLATALLALLTRWDATLAAHPAQLVLLLATAAGGAALVVAGRRGGPGRRGGRWTALRIVGVITSLAFGALLIWLRPFTATERALTALESGGGVRVDESATRIRLEPEAAPAGRAALVFVPGARVDPRAYGAALRPLAAAGHPVVIVKPPLGIGLLARGAAGAELDAAREDGRPAVAGGHSLGGTAAAMAAEEDGAADGLLLWASFPANDALAGREDLAAASVSGTRDGLATPQDIADSREDLPPRTRFTAVPGAVHADFGDYGDQRGDGTRAISHEAAQAAIAAASLDLLRDAR